MKVLSYTTGAILDMEDETPQQFCERIGMSYYEDPFDHKGKSFLGIVRMPGNQETYRFFILDETT